MVNFRVDLSQQTAIVTGGGAGAGRAIAIALGVAGSAVVVNDLNPDRAKNVADEIVTVGGKALGWQADVSNRFQVSAMIEQARDQFGSIHILVNAAGVFKHAPLVDLDEWDWQRQLDVNLTGAFFCLQLLSRVMVDEGGGVIVNIVSTAGHPNPLPDGVGYVASKAGLLGLTKQSARELAPHNIRVNAVCPGNIIEDDYTDYGEPANAQARFGAPEDVADVVLFLCSDAARFITGQAINVDGGENMV